MSTATVTGWGQREAELAAADDTHGRDYGPADQELTGHQRVAHRLAVDARGRVLWVDGLGWHSWDGRRWERTDKGAYEALERLLRDMWVQSRTDAELQRDYRSASSAHGTTGVLALARFKEGMHARADDMDADPHLLNCANGTLDLRTLELREHDPRDRITKITAASYDPQAPRASWESFLASSLPDRDARGFLHRWAGSTLMGVIRDHVLPVATGTGRNGKGTAYEAIMRALGGYATAAPTSLFVAGRDGGRSASDYAARMVLRGARFVVVSELEDGDRLAKANMKLITGGDRITAKFMGKDFVTFDPSHHVLMVTNALPAVAGDDPAVWDRIRVIPFNVSFRGREDVGLKDRIAAELDGVLAWLVEGLHEYRERGLDAPAAVMSATSEYRAENDAVRRFLDARCVRVPHAWVSQRELAEEYARWASEEREEPLTSRQFNKRVRAAGVGEGQDPSGKARAWRGLGLVDGALSDSSDSQSRSSLYLPSQGDNREQLSEPSENAVTSGDAEGPPEAPQLVRRAIAGRPAWVDLASGAVTWDAS